MEHIQSSNEFRELCKAGQGLIYNDFAGRGSGGREYNVLHSAACRWLSQANLNVPKIYVNDRQEAEAWLAVYRGAEGHGWKRCGTCGADRAQQTQPLDATPVGTPSGRGFAVAGLSDDHPFVEAWSEQRLPFGAQGAMKNLQLCLREALSSLVAARNEVLAATYVSAVQERCDADNILVYNLESPSSLRSSTTRGLRIERAYREPPDGPGDLRHALHYHRYELVPVSMGWREWVEARVLATTDVAVELHQLSSATASWWKLRSRGWSVATSDVSPTGPVGLKIIIEAPLARAPEPAVVVKPLIDGIVASLQSHVDPGDLAEVTTRIARRVGGDSKEVASLLASREQAVLGSTRLVWPWRDSIQWNPSDDRCVAVDIILESTDEDACLRAAVVEIEENSAA